jgi:hypothetical protein
MSKRALAAAILRAILVPLLLTQCSGCFSYYTAWRIDCHNRKAGAAYREATGDKVLADQLVGAWTYEVSSFRSKLSQPNLVQLALCCDGSFSRLTIDRTSVFCPHWIFDSGTWKNLGDMKVSLAVRSANGGETLETVDLSRCASGSDRRLEAFKAGAQPGSFK